MKFRDQYVTLCRTLPEVSEDDEPMITVYCLILIYPFENLHLWQSKDYATATAK